MYIQCQCFFLIFSINSSNFKEMFVGIPEKAEQKVDKTEKQIYNKTEVIIWLMKN